MASNFSANQFEDSFRPKSLCNWEVPHWYPQHPHRRTTVTKFIADDKGHLLSGIERPKSSPWGRFLSTSQLPKRITRKQANELNAPPVGSSRWALPDPEKKVKMVNEEVQVQIKSEKDDGKMEEEEIESDEEVETHKPVSSVQTREFNAKETLNNPLAIARQGRRSIRHETLERDDDHH